MKTPRDLVIGRSDDLEFAKLKHGLPRHLQNGWRVLVATIREIFDESAYERFLTRTNGAHSAETYRAFMRERENLMARKPRCC